MLHAHSHCQRWIDISEDVQVNDSTEKMYYELDYDMEKSGFFSELRKKAGQEGLDTAETHRLCDAIHWMRLSNRKLAFDMTEEEMSRCELGK